VRVQAHSLERIQGEAAARAAAAVKAPKKKKKKWLPCERTSKRRKRPEQPDAQEHPATDASPASC